MNNNIFSGKRGVFSLKDLNATGTLKDMVFINAQKFWPALPNYWMGIRNAEKAFSEGCYALQMFVSSSKDANLKRDILLKVK